MRRLRKSLGILALIIILIELVLVFSGILDLLSAAKFVIAVELSLLALVVCEILIVAKAVSSAKASGKDLPFALEAALAEFFPDAVARYLRQDFMLLRAIWMLLTGRRDIAEGERALPYSSPLVPMLSALAIVDGLVAFAVHMLLPAGWIRTLALILGILGFIWLVGFVASLVVYPHVLGDDRFRLRFGVFQDILIPRISIESAEPFREDPGSTHSAACFDGRLIMVVANQTNVRLRVTRIESLMSLSPKLSGHPVSEVVFYTDSNRDAWSSLVPMNRPAD